MADIEDRLAVEILQRGSRRQSQHFPLDTSKQGEMSNWTGRVERVHKGPIYLLVGLCRWYQPRYNV